MSTLPETIQTIKRTADMTATAITSTWLARYLRYIDDGLTPTDASVKADEDLAVAVDGLSESRTAEMVSLLVENAVRVLAAGVA